MVSVRSPPGPRTTACAPSTSQTVDRSSAGSAWHSEPPSVPRLRTIGSAMTFSASRMIGNSPARERTSLAELGSHGSTSGVGMPVVVTSGGCATQDPVPQS